jgi:hypothetical protein
LPPAVQLGQFADEVLPHVGLSALPGQIGLACSDLSTNRIEYWAAELNAMNDELQSRFADEPGGWTEEEMDGVWYDRMKSIALECLDECQNGAAT